MTYNFKNAILRKPSKNINKALSSQNFNPIYKNIIKEHDTYLKTLRKLGLKINLLESLQEYPDSMFVEDPAIIFKKTWKSLVFL